MTVIPFLNHRGAEAHFLFEKTLKVKTTLILINAKFKLDSFSLLFLVLVLGDFDLVDAMVQ